MPVNSGSDECVQQTIALELTLLRMLCGPELAANARESAMGSLARHAWRDDEHRVVFESLRRIRIFGSSSIHAELPAAATRLGFPDVDWGRYFTGNEERGPEEIKNLIHALTSSTTYNSRQP